MTVEKPPIAVCPHCGFESDDEELCRACGKLTNGDIPVRNVSLADIFGGVCSRLKEKGFGGGDYIPKDIGEEPNLNPLPGSSWFIHHHDYDED